MCARLMNSVWTASYLHVNITVEMLPAHQQEKHARIIIVTAVISFADESLFKDSVFFTVWNRSAILWILNLILVFRQAIPSHLAIYYTHLMVNNNTFHNLISMFRCCFSAELLVIIENKKKSLMFYKTQRGYCNCLQLCYTSPPKTYDDWMH